jgi:predicted DNA-binding protein (UPF0251 family)
MEIFTLSAKEIDRLEIVQLVIAKRLSVTKAAGLCGVSRTWMSQQVNAYRRNGAVALASGRRVCPERKHLCAHDGYAPLCFAPWPSPRPYTDKATVLS